MKSATNTRNRNLITYAVYVTFQPENVSSFSFAKLFSLAFHPTEG
jgi:hypothetical protein